MFRNTKRKRIKRLEKAVADATTIIENLREQPVMLVLTSQKQVEGVVNILREVNLGDGDEQHLIQPPFDGTARAVCVCSPVNDEDPDYRGTGVWISPTGRATPGLEDQPPCAGDMDTSDGLGG